MNPDNPPLDINLTVGSQKDSPDLLSLDISLMQQQKEITEVINSWAIGQQFLQGFMKQGGILVVLDFDVQEGKEKEAKLYLEKDIEKSSSPLQVLLNNYDYKCNGKIKRIIEQQKGFVRVIYSYPTDVAQNYRFKSFNQIVYKLQQQNFNPPNNMHLNLKGKVVEKQKNIHLKVDFAKFSCFSNSLVFKDFLSCLSLIEQLSAFENHPLMKLAQRAKSTKIDISLKDFSELRKYYLQQTQNFKKSNLNYQIPGIFKNDFKSSIIFDNRFILEVKGRYHSEDVFMRLITNYSQLFEVLFKKSFFHV